MIVLTVGSDAAVGKMTASLELAQLRARAAPTPRSCRPDRSGSRSPAGERRSIASSPTSRPGAAEQLVLEGDRRARDLLFLEGQGGINNPAFAPVTLALMYGGAPDALVLVHNVKRHVIEDYDVPILSYRTLIRIYESLCGTVKPAPVVGVALNTRDCTEAEAQAEIERARRETGLPCDDVVRNGPQVLYAAIAPSLQEKQGAPG